MPPRSRRAGAGPCGVRVDVARRGVRAGLSDAAVRRVVTGVLQAERVRAAVVSVTFLSAAAMARANARFLGRRGSTDVIAFGMVGGAALRVADIYIAPLVAQRNAHAAGVSVREEVIRLVVHGTLHALGYDHPDGAGREHSAMWRRQEALVARARRTLAS